MKKILMPLVIVVVFVACAVGIYFGFANKGNVELNVSVSDITVKIGETVKINYKCSNDSAEIVFESQDSDTAEIVTLGNVYYVKGNKLGEAKIVGTFKYGKYKNTRYAKVTVVDGSQAEDDNDFEMDKIDFSKNLNNITYDNEIFTMTSESGSFTITPKEGKTISYQDVKCFDENVSIEKEEILGVNVYSITCSAKGNYELKITVDGKTKTFSLIYE